MTHEHQHHHHGHHNGCPAKDNTPVIVGYARTPFMLAMSPVDVAAGKKEPGRFAHIDPLDMSVALVNKIIDDTQIDPTKVEFLYMGTVNQEAEQGANPGRNVVLHNGCKLTELTPGDSIDMFCASSAATIAAAKNHIAAGEADLIFAGGMQSMSLLPMGGYTIKIHPQVDAGRPKGWFDMGVTAEYLAQKYNITREEQQQFALESHQKVLKARERGYFADEIVPIDGVSVDDIARADTSLERMSRLKTSFMSEDRGGTVTPATSSPLTDGATMTLLSSKSYAKENNLPVMAEVVAWAATGCAPEIMGIGPVEAVKKVLRIAGLTMQDINERGIVEFNEAFAAQVLAVEKELASQGMAIDPAIRNIDGGALALGHPLGASGGRLAGHGARIMNRLNKEFCLVAMCVGGGMGAAMLLRNPDFSRPCCAPAPCAK